MDQSTSYTTTSSGCSLPYANCSDSPENAFNDTSSIDYFLINNTQGDYLNITLDYGSDLGTVIGNPTNDTICLSENDVCLGNFNYHDYFQFLSIYNETMKTDAHTVIGLAP